MKATELTQDQINLVVELISKADKATEKMFDWWGKCMALEKEVARLNQIIENAKSELTK